MRSSHETKTRDRRTLRQRLFRLAKPSLLPLGCIFLLAAVSVPLGMLMPLPLKIAVDSVIGQQPLPPALAHIVPAWLLSSRGTTLGLAIALLLALAVISNLQVLASWLLQTYIGERLVFELRTQLFWHSQRLGLATHDRRGVNDIAYRIQHDSPAIQFIFMQGFVPLLTSTLAFVGMLYVTMRIDWAIATVALVLSPAMLIAARQAGRRARKGWQEVKTLDSSAMLLMSEALSSIRVVKAFNKEDFENARFRMRSRERMSEQVRLASAQAGYHLVISSVIALGSAAALFIGVRHVVGGVITLGDLLLVMAYVAQLYDPLRTISNKLPELQSWMVSLERSFALFDETPEIVEPVAAASASRASGQVTFENVTFEYASSGRALNQVSFEIPAGTRVGIVGPSGSGKTTLVNLLTRFYDPSSGRILLDGRDVRDCNVKDLRQQFAVIGQEPVMFSSTVAENIAYGRLDASRQEVMQAAIAAEAHDFIMALPKAYDTKIGEGGCRLSGGQRQRIAIARAFLKDAPILVLDEPTSALDAKTESGVLQAMENLMAGRTTFIIAHRLNTIRSCDLLLVLEQGRLKSVLSRDAIIESHRTFENALLNPTADFVAASAGSFS
jgi:ATP-binding cassette subfamily B protein